MDLFDSTCFMIGPLMINKFNILLCAIVFFLNCTSDKVVKFFEYPDHNVLNIGSQLTDLYITTDSNTLIAADKGNNRVIFIDVSSDAMYIKNTVWVGSEPTSLDMTDDGRYLFVGLLGGSSVSIINIENMTLEGRLNLQQDSIFDIEYLSNKCQLIVSFLSSNPTFNNTYVHTWWADEDGIWYGSLLTFESTKGYWVKVQSELSFSYDLTNLSEDATSRLSTDKTPAGFEYKQS